MDLRSLYRVVVFLSYSSIRALRDFTFLFIQNQQIIEKGGPRGYLFCCRKRLNFAPKRPLRAQRKKSRSVSKRRKTVQLRSKTVSSIQHNSVLVVTSQSLRGYFAVTSRSQRGHYAVTTVTTRSLRGHYGHYAVTTVTTRSEKAHIRDSTSLQNGLFDQEIVAVGL